MTVSKLSQALSLTPISMPRGERDFQGVYIGDLLSWVMGRAESGNVWITIMSNVNVIAVATLADVACILLAEGVTLEKDLCQTAEQKGINVYSSSKTAYELAARLADLLK